MTTISITVKDIHKEVMKINAASYSTYGSKFGVSNLHREIGDDAYGEAISNVSKESLAYKILKQIGAMKAMRISEKQAWVVAFELFKNSEFVAKMTAAKERYEAWLCGDADEY